MSLTQEWVPNEDEVPADHWSKSPEYLAEKAAGIEIPQKLTPEVNDLPHLPQFTQTKKIEPLKFRKGVNTHKLAMSALEVPYVLTDEDKERIAKQEADAARQALIDNKDIYEELAKNLLGKVSEVVDA
jgi:hypothetical protein